MRISLSIENLQDAYDVCLIMKDWCGNVIASGDFAESDKENHAKSKRFMEAFNRALKDNPDRKKAAKDWKRSLAKSMSKLNDSLDLLSESESLNLKNK